MANNANLVVATSAMGSDGLGLAWFAPTGSTAPTNTSGSLDAAFKDAGGISEEGLSLAMNETTKKIKFFGSQLSQRNVVTDQETTWKLKFMEHNATSLGIYWRQVLGSITPAVSTGAFGVAHGSFVARFYSFVADIADGNNRIRAYCPRVEVSNRDDLAFGNGNEVGYGVEMTAYPVSGVAIQWYYAIPSLG